MIKTLTKHDDGWALVIDQEVLDSMNIEPETPLRVHTNGQTMIVSPVPDPERQAKFEEALRETNRRYAQTLQRLAE